MQLSVLTYNVLFNKAVVGLPHIVAETKPDVICLQEIDTDPEKLKKCQPEGYVLADYSNSFIKFGRIFGLATYYKKNTLRLVQSNSLNLPRSIIEALLVILRGGNNPRTVLKTIFSMGNIKKKIALYNIHLTALGSNGARLKQLKGTLDDLAEDTHLNYPTIVAGDFNYYPMRRKKLEQILDKYQMREATANIVYTFDKKRYQDDLLHTIAFKFIPRTSRSKCDYIFYRDLRLKHTEKIDIKLSDHFPVISTFELL